MVNQSVEHGVATTCTTQSLGEFLTEGLLKEQPTKVKPVHICASGGKKKCKEKVAIRKKGREREQKETKGR